MSAGIVAVSSETFRHLLDPGTSHMKHDGQNHAASSSRPDWSYTVQAPRTFSVLWALERMAALSVPIAGIGLFAVAHSLGLIGQQ